MGPLQQSLARPAEVQQQHAVQRGRCQQTRRCLSRLGVGHGVISAGGRQGDKGVLFWQPVDGPGLAAGTGLPDVIAQQLRTCTSIHA